MEHLQFKSNNQSLPHTGKGGGKSKKHNRSENWHQIKQNEFNNLIEEREKTGTPINKSIHFELSNIKDEDNISLIKQLDSETKGIRLLSIKEYNDKIVANIQFKNKRACDNFKLYNEDGSSKPLSSIINEIKERNIDDLIIDILPDDYNKENYYWFEIWVTEAQNEFFKELKELKKTNKKLLFNPNPLILEDLIVVLVKTTINFVENNIKFPNIAEIHFAKREKIHYLDIDIEEKQQIDISILERIEVKDSRTCLVLMDTGVNSNPLLKKVITDDLLLTINEDYGTYDNGHHGTAMAGLCLYGDFIDLIDKSNSISLDYKLASVKIYDPSTNEDKFFQEKPESIVKNVILLSEEKLPHYNNKLYVSANTTNYSSGMPSSYSIDLDLNIYNKNLLFLVSVGNFYNPNINFNLYETDQKTAIIQDPSQSWNALSVGAFTDKYGKLIEENFTPLYKKGDVSPFTRFKNKEWKKSNLPLKPEILFEGGNIAVDIDKKVIIHNNLVPLSTNAEFNKDNYLLTSINGTSSAVALAGKFAASLMARYPIYWAETIKAIMVHSAEYTSYMEEEKVKSYNNLKNVEDRYSFLHKYSYGVPNLEKAKESIENRVTLVAQEEIQIFETEYMEGKKAGTKKKIPGKKFRCKMFNLPFPKKVLQELGNQPIKLIVTLSYFISPKAGSITNINIDKFRYQSYGLRFELKRLLETSEDFLERVTSPKKGKKYNKNTLNWDLGYEVRNKIAGTVLKDTWNGTAIELLSMDKLIVYPVGGWWKDDNRIKSEDTKTRFSLVLTIETEKEDIKLYTEIKNMIDVPITV